MEEEEISDGKGGYPARKKYNLPADAIIPLPTTLPDPVKKVGRFLSFRCSFFWSLLFTFFFSFFSRNQLEFATDKKVLALYPGTTCFYEATVVHPPSRRKKEFDYVVQFEDDEESESPVKAIPQMFVLNMPSQNDTSSP